MRYFKCSTHGVRPGNHEDLQHDVLDAGGGKLTVCTKCGEEAESLTPAADLIRAPGRWTQGFYAKSASGERVGSWKPEAVCFCAIGAIQLAYTETEQRTRLILTLRDSIPLDVGAWNDAPERTQEEVVAALEAAELEVNGVKE